MILLWKIFYTFEDNRNYSESTFFSLGSGLLLSFNEPFSLQNRHILLKIKFYDNINNNYHDVTDHKKIDLLNINNDFLFNYDD